jgi:peroxiredoxin
MKNRAVKIGFMFFAMLCVLALAGWKVYERMAREGREELGVASPVKMAGPVPAFDLEDWQGKRAAPADYKGRWVLLNYWATWCTSCAEELPSMSAFNRAFGPKGLDVVAVSVDEEWAPVKGFFPHAPPSFRILLDPKGKVAAQFGTVKFPETYLIDPSGGYRAKFIGPRTWTDPRIVRYFEKIMGAR